MGMMKLKGTHKSTLTNVISKQALSDGADGGEEEDEEAFSPFAGKEAKMKKLGSLVSAVFLTLITASLALAAAEGPAVSAGDAQVKAAVAIAAGLAVAIAAFGAALGQGRVGATAMESIGRNPNAADRLFLPLLLSLALLEALALYGFVIAFLLQGKI
jgi:F-type H+-transporting ATPase subunit c